MALLNAFRSIEDPFSIEIAGKTGGGAGESDQIEDDSAGRFDYEWNPSEPSKPNKQARITPFEKKSWE